MKKLITLLLLFVGMVSSVSAGTKYIVYFKPGSTWADGSAAFRLNMKKSTSDDWHTENFVQTATSGLYSAEFDTDYDAGFEILRYNSDYTSFWNKSNWIDAPTSHLYIDKSGNNYYNEWDLSTTGMSIKYPSAYGTTNPKCRIAGDTYIINGSNAWDTDFDHTGDNMTYNDDFTYTLDVAEKFIFAGNREFKIYRSDVGYCGDPKNSGNNFQLSIAECDKYTIKYVYNILTGDVEKTPTKKNVVDMKYTVQRGVDNGSGGYNYTNLGEMSIVDSHPTVVSSPVTLAAASNDLLWKVEWEAWVGESKIADNWTYDGSGVDGHFAYTPSEAGNFTVTFVYDPYTNTSSATPNVKLGSKYYYLGGSGTWPINQDVELTDNGAGVFSATVSNKAGQTFAIVPDFAFSNETTIADGNWKYAIHPKADANVSVTFANNSGETEQKDGSINWQVDNDYSDFITINFTPATNTWSIEPYFQRTINASAGYATFSSAYDVAVAGATAYYCRGIDGSKELVMDTFSGGIPAGEGALLQGSGDVTFTPAASTPDVPVTNWLKPGTGATVPQTDGSGNTNFILTNNTVNGSADLKFYKVNSAGNTVAAGKAYLQIPSAYVGAHEYFWFEDETTGIESMKTAQKMNGEFFNLAGQRVAQPAKGLYIVNGKKVIMK